MVVASFKLIHTLMAEGTTKSGTEVFYLASSFCNGVFVTCFLNGVAEKYIRNASVHTYILYIISFKSCRDRALRIALMSRTPYSIERFKN